jgi:RNA polymerase sigma-70 factor (ECF subfamily)
MAIPMRNGVPQLVEAARKAWTQFKVEPQDFANYLDERSISDGVDPAIACDLYLACACTRGDRAALAELDSRFLSSVPTYIARIDGTPEFSDEVRQRLREHLLVAANASRARIGDYRGRGPLGAWLRVAAVRIALNLIRARRKRERAVSDGAGDRDRDVAAARSPERALLGAGYRTAVENALEATLVDLAADDRTILRFYYLDDMTITEIGKVLAIHPSTVARRIERCRETILSETRRSLGVELQLDDDDLDSVIRLAQSQLDISLRRLLQPEP